MVVKHNNTLEDNIPSVGSPVTEGKIYDRHIWGDDGINPRKPANHHCSGTKLLSVRPSTITNLTPL